MAAAQEQSNGSDTRSANFALKDYELKVAYMTNHLQRMWTRFNYFVVINTALIGTTIFGEDQLSRGGIGLGLSLLWYVMGAEDRYLFDHYRREAKCAGAHAAEVSGGQPDQSVGRVLYHAVGYVPDRPERKSPLSWRIPAISTTRLAALIPLLVSVAWVGLLLAELIN